MSGHIARKGFHFQDLYLLRRVLQAASDSLDSAWRAGSGDVLASLDRVPMRFGLEASAKVTTDNGLDVTELDWDVLVLGESRLEFAEVKSGLVTKDDRLAFWRRLRRELTRGNHANVSLAPTLVVDPSKVDALDKWRELPAEAAVVASHPLQEPSGNILTSKELLEEAVWWMCRPDNSQDSSDPPADFSNAIDALKRFQLHCHEAQHLELQVRQYIEVLFPGGFTETQQTLLLGWLNKRATDREEERRVFSIRDLLAEIGILKDAISLAPGVLKEWRDLWNEVPSGVRARIRLRLGKDGASVPAAQVQPFALDALTNGDKRPLVILAPGGAGKSTFVAQAAHAAATSGDDVMHCGADDINPDELEQLTKAIRFFAALMALRVPEARLSLCVDGLDEADSSLRKRWAQILVRVAGLPNVRTLVSMRDAIWRSDGDIRKELESWQVVSLDLWPDSLVRELLASTQFQPTLPAPVIDLLRTPILLDLFWSAFVEAGIPDVPRASRLQTRHSLLAAFWDERLLASPRNSSISDIVSRIMTVISQSALSVGGFPETNLDAVGVRVLLSEGVLVREGRLQPKLRFRHPLLRDFALAQWCLESSEPIKVARRWNSIRGGLQRHGALRAIFEALSDPDANIEYPELPLGIVVQAIVSSDPSLATQVAHVLGTREPIPVLDPATWPPPVQSALPAEFARDLLSAARLDGNSAWATPLEKWPTDTQWLNKDYAGEVWNYASFVSERARSKPGDAVLREYSRQAARKLRSISEDPRFANEFAESERWLKMQAMLCVIPVLPDEATVYWVEREMPQSTWRTRSFLLEKLVHLAHVDAPRTAEIYRQAVGLTQENGRPVVNASLWFGTMDHQAIEWSLAGENGKRSLLKEHPEVFLPVALDLAEGLWTQKNESREYDKPNWSYLWKKIDPSWTEETQQKLDHERQLRLGELIDDAPEWRCWRSLPVESYDRCLKAIHECVDHLAQQSPRVFESSIGILRSSRMASVQMILFDVALEHQQRPASQGSLRDSVLDTRLYYVSGFDYWIEQGLMAVWPNLKREDRVRVFEILRKLLAIEESKDHARHFLARLPADELPDDLRLQRPSHDDASYHARTRPNRGDFGFSGEWTPVESNEARIEMGQWPEEFDRDLLMNFARFTSSLSNKETPVEKLRENETVAMETVKALLPRLLKHVDLLEDTSRFWVWQGLTHMLACFRRTRELEAVNPDPKVVLACAELAIGVLKNVPRELPGSLPEGDVWIGKRETSWGHALHLADEALTWLPAADDRRLQSQFIEVIKAAYATEHPMVQLVCSITIRPWHWFRTLERRQLHDELVWKRQQNPSVLAWSLMHLKNSADVDRARIFRLLLNRSDLSSDNNLANYLGRFVGNGSMLVFPDGQRSAAAEVARDVINAPQAFPFLKEASSRSEFLRGFIFGMKEQARLVSSINPQLAADYGDWALKVWRVMFAQCKKRNESKDVVLLAMHWIEKGEKQHDRTHLKLWWQHLQPLFEAVIREGGRPDCFTLLFNFRGGEYNDLTSPEELLSLLEVFVERVRVGGLAGAMDVNARVPEGDDYHSWRDCAEYAAETCESLRNDGSLRTDVLRERAYALLWTLAAEPVRSSRAIAGLHRLQNG